MSEPQQRALDGARRMLMADLEISRAQDEVRVAWREAQSARGEQYAREALVALWITSDHLISLKERLR